jgi:hypothetical protein
MSGHERTPHKGQFPNEIGKSIFPKFDVNVPMPSGTAVPPTEPSWPEPSHPSRPSDSNTPTKKGN